VCRQAVETATGTLETDEAASRRVRHRAAGCEPCEAVECVSSRGLPWPRLRRVCEFIQHNLNQQLTLLKSPRPGSHEPLPFRATFQAACRRTPARCVLGRHIARASAPLREPQLSIGEVCRLVGFRPPSRFTTPFRRMTGITPSAYRCGMAP